MLDLDYTLVTDKGSKNRVDTPLEKMKHNDGNVFLVQGPSSMGKSSVMNMIAIGCFGETNERLSQSVRANLRELTSSDYRELTFNIKIDNPNNGILLELQKGRGKSDIAVFETINGAKKALSVESFRKKYNLIYDVPENPTKRLEQIRDTIVRDHDEANKNIASFIDRVKSIRNEFKSYPSADEIRNDRGDLKNLRYIIDEKENRLEGLKQSKEYAECALACKLYDECKKREELINGQIWKEEQKPLSGKTNTDKKIEALKKYRDLYPAIKISHKTHLDIISTKNTVLISWLEKIDKFDFESNRNNLDSYEKMLLELYRAIPDNKDDTGRERLVNDIIRLLRDYSDKNVVLGDAGSVKQLLDALNKYKENEFSGIDYARIKSDVGNAINKFESVKRAADKVDTATDKPADYADYRDTSKLDKLYADKRANTNQLESAKSTLRSKDIGFDTIYSKLLNYCRLLGIESTSDSTVFEKKKQECTVAYQTLKDDVEKDQRYYKELAEKCKRYEGLTKPPFYDDRRIIPEILDACNTLRSKITKASDRLQKIIRFDKSEYSVNPELYEPIWSYIGSKLEKVYDCGIEYEVESVDLLIEEKGAIKTKDGVIIHIGAMGTGEGQLSYLRGLLTTGDSRKIVALFDEVGNMSNNLLKALSDDFVRLNKEGKLMLAFMARPTSDLFEVVSYD